MTNGSFIKFKIIAECSLWKREHSAILLTCIKRQLVLKTNFLSFWEWPFYTGFTVLVQAVYWFFFIILRKLYKHWKQSTDCNHYKQKSYKMKLHKYWKQSSLFYSLKPAQGDHRGHCFGWHNPGLPLLVHMGRSGSALDLPALSPYTDGKPTLQRRTFPIIQTQTHITYWHHSW